MSKENFFARFKKRSRPRRPWIIVVAAALLIGSFTLVFAFYQMKTSSGIAAKVKTTAMRNDVQSTPGGDASEEYRKKVEELNRIEVASAESEGKSYIPSVAGQISEQEPLEDLSLESKPESKPEPKTQDKKNSAEPEVEALESRMLAMQQRMEALNRQKYQAPRAEPQPRDDGRLMESYTRQYGRQLAEMTAELDQDFAEQQIIVFKPSVAYADVSGTDAGAANDGRESSRPGDANDTDNSGLELKPGDLLYARNEIHLNSDAPGPAQATVLAGEFQGAILLGQFDKAHNYLRVKFGRMILPDGTEYKVDAVAIDPDVSATAVRSDVDRHILQRWGGLMGASFLAGFGEAVSKSGSEIVVSDGTTISSQPELDTEEELWAAAGRVGEQLASVLERNFNRPSTVTLDPGINIGILFLSVEKQEG